MAVRQATHAGSWYSDVPEELSEDLQRWLQEAAAVNSPARAIIAPHAGYRFSGPCAGHAYKQIDPSLVRRVFILGPSHHKWLTTCALTRTQRYQTPLYDLLVDTQVCSELQSTREFEWVDLKVEEKEHSIEMQLPYVAKVMEKYAGDFTIVPVLVGTLSSEQQKRLGKIFAKYLAHPRSLFVISSDFCHWGKKFSFTNYDTTSRKPIHQFIEEMDKMGMDAIESLNPKTFGTYMNEYCNTICGRNPIYILLHAVKELMEQERVNDASLKFIKYEQSQKCSTMQDSSVSYAAASLVFS